jgi:hypothetical protein
MEGLYSFYKLERSVRIGSDNNNRTMRIEWDWTTWTIQVQLNSTFRAKTLRVRRLLTKPEDFRWKRRRFPCIFQAVEYLSIWSFLVLFFYISILGENDFNLLRCQEKTITHIDFEHWTAKCDYWKLRVKSWLFYI